jgi:hypothetical protein
MAQTCMWPIPAATHAATRTPAFLRDESPWDLLALVIPWPSMKERYTCQYVRYT